MIIVIVIEEAPHKHKKANHVVSLLVGTTFSCQVCLYKHASQNSFNLSPSLRFSSVHCRTGLLFSPTLWMLKKMQIRLQSPFALLQTLFFQNR